MNIARREEGYEEKAANLAALCQALQENRLDTSELLLLRQRHRYPALDDAFATQIGAALRGNTVVTYLQIPVELMTASGTVGIARFIASSTSLSRLQLLTARALDVRSTREHAAVVDQYISAVSDNGKIQHLEFWPIPMRFGVGPLASCIQANQKSLVSLSFFLSSFQHVEDLVMNPSMMVGANFFASVVSALPFLKKLAVCCDRNEHLLVPILTRFVNHASLQKLAILQWKSASTSATQVCNTLVSLLQSSTPLKGLALDIRANPGDDPNREAFNAVFPVLQGHKTLRRLNFFAAPDRDEGAAQVAAMLRHNESITYVKLACYSLVGLSTVLEALGTNSSVIKLSVVLSTLHGEALSSEGGRRLIDVLPRTRHLKEMSLMNRSNDRLGEGVQADVLCALKQNTSLTRVKIGCLVADPEAQTTIEYYTTRNRLAPQLASASKANMLTIFEAALFDHGDLGLSLVFDTLCVRDDWYDTADVQNRQRSTTRVSDGGSGKRERVTTTK
jgi:hypothetical protein